MHRLSETSLCLAHNFVMEFENKLAQVIIKNLLSPAHNFSCIMGFQKYMPRCSVACKDHVSSLKVNFIIQTYAVKRL